MRSPPPPKLCVGDLSCVAPTFRVSFHSRRFAICRPSSALQQSLFEVSTPVFTVN